MRIGSLHFPKAFVAGAAIYAVGIAAGSIIAPVEVRLIESITDSSAAIGAIYAIGSIFFALLSVYLGRLSDRRGRHDLITAGIGIGIIYPLLYATAANGLAYGGVRFFWAASAVMTGPVLAAYLQDAIQDHPNKGQLLAPTLNSKIRRDREAKG